MIADLLHVYGVWFLVASAGFLPAVFSNFGRPIFSTLKGGSDA